MRYVCFVTAFAALFTLPTLGGGPSPQPGGFNYQFQLRQNGAPYNGTADFEFRLYDGPHGTGATQIGPTLPVMQTITDGTSNTILLFEQPAPAPPVWNGDERWLEVRVRTPAGSANPFVALTPWQRISNTPYAAYALSAALAGTYGSPVNFSNPGNAFAGSGAALTALNAANIGSGSLNVARLPSGGAWSLASNLSINSNALVVEQATGEVGIGTATPTATLEVARSVANNLNPSLLIRQAGAGSTSSVRFQNASNNHFNLGMTAGNEFALGYNANISLGGDLLRILPGGQVGIGSSPDARLHVNMSETGNPLVLAGAPLMLESMTDNWISMMTDSADLSGIAFGRPGATPADVMHGGIVYNDGVANGMEFRTGGNQTRMTIDSAGLVGIGTTAPAAPLHAIGDVRTDGRLLLADGTAAAPVLTFTGDSNTGIFRAGADSLNLVTGGSERLRVDASGVHIPATQRKLSIPFAAFEPSSHTTQFTSLSTISGTQAGASVTFVAPVLLPDGATINSMRVFFSDGDGTNDIHVEIRSHNYFSSGGGGAIMGGITSSGSIPTNVTQSLSDISLSFNVIDNADNCYSLRAEWIVPATPANIRLHGVVLTYTITSPLP